MARLVSRNMYNGSIRVLQYLINQLVPFCQGFQKQETHYGVVSVDYAKQLIKVIQLLNTINWLIDGYLLNSHSKILIHHPSYNVLPFQPPRMQLELIIAMHSNLITLMIMRNLLCGLMLTICRSICFLIISSGLLPVL